MAAALRAVWAEADPPGAPGHGNGGRGGGDVKERLTALETEMKHVALREDVLGLKIWILLSVIGGMAVAASLALGIANLW